ncbi:26S protease regulatory subunit 10B [Thecamonas trahens ATCC 50062]|uniref:26S protease regulatory subunit 10B n=1 Tax=Thecamonas trahens ATCC 50062 TaxID=461836 RepID=A0A0L0DES0_THETB|nr:26S protease regulatory subunit 10B [Thecamonas trahens ATCC 50062]KNC50715.1 26S protease regulatory subunit 10B [Thecamonas trahens ATCC 50062]|eukprot:XP_013756685.1 26S protease regulatory subunit 10B [Thecamonas trahens ATCC 50062]
MSSDQQAALSAYRSKLLQHRELSSRVRELRAQVKQQQKDYDKSEDDLTALQSIGQIIGEVIRHLDGDRFIVKASSGPRYVVGVRTKLDKAKLVPSTRVALDMTTLTIMRILPREVDPLVFNMVSEDPGDVSYSSIGGLAEQIRELREVVELPLINPELFLRVGIKPPKGTLLARAVAAQMNCSFLKVVSSAIVDKYIGESARVIREMFAWAKTNAPCIVFMDEIDAIGGKRFNQGTSADREIQRTLMELLNCMDGFDTLDGVKIVMATNRPDVLDPALLRPGRLDRKVEIPLPNEEARRDILTIHSAKIVKMGELNFDSAVRLSDGFNGADLRNVCTEAGLFALRDDRAYVTEGDFMKAVRKIREAKKLETKLDYGKV